MNKEILKVLNKYFDTSFIIKFESSAVNIYFESDSKYIHFNKSLYNSNDLDTVRISIKDVEYIKSKHTNEKYIVFSFLDKIGFHKIINDNKYSTIPIGKFDRFFIEFGDHYYLPTADLIYIY